ncbi:MAG TPA: hypothetical protein PKE45_13110, partial [Caldilineaceae bacterium]|nr:hypothetical protein [Caldilineaceae bacterium]
NGAAEVGETTAQNGYVTVNLGPGQSATLHYPLAERTTHYEVGAPGRTLAGSGAWRGETLMRIDPPGPYYPLYQRSADLPPVQPALPAQPLFDSV